MATIAVLLLVGPLPAAPRGVEPVPVPKDALLVVFIDVGQGDASLVLLPTGEAIVIDGGDEGHGHFDVRPVLEAYGVSAIDLLVSTHPHGDHMNGLDEIMGSFPVYEIWDIGSEPKDAAFRAYASARDSSGAWVLDPAIGHEKILGGAKIRVLSAMRSRGRGKGQPNDDSMVVMIEYAGRHILFAADAEAKAERWLVSTYGEALACDVLKAPHHGSNKFDARFLTLAHPAFAVISVAADNAYGLPKPRHLAALESMGTEVCCTGWSGDVAAVVSAAGVDFYCAR